MKKLLMAAMAEECLGRSLRPSLKVLAVERTTHVTNIAEAAYLSGDMAVSDGTHRLVWDMDAQNIFQGLVSTNLEVFVSVEVDKAWYGVQLWENGPYWAECNVGAGNPEEFGSYFMVGRRRRLQAQCERRRLGFGRGRNGV